MVNHQAVTELEERASTIVQNVYKAVKDHQAAEESATNFLDDVLKGVSEESDLKAQSKAIVQGVYKEVSKEFQLREEAKVIVQNAYQAARDIKAAEDLAAGFLHEVIEAARVQKDAEDSALAFVDGILEDAQKESEGREQAKIIVQDVLTEVSKDNWLHVQTQDGEKKKNQDDATGSSHQADCEGPVDYSDLCPPQSYYINGIKIDAVDLQTRKELLSSRGPWPGRDVITYQDQFVADMRAMEEELASGGTHDGVKDARDSVDSDSDRVFTGESRPDSEDEDEDGVTISFIMGSEGAERDASL
ncbi:uncharacterized protein [Diadema setosum]|uniref:uncharacterized protein n=1 Tax=Diadema setosum TaxID=31175 RepID=UPI003B3A75B2